MKRVRIRDYTNYFYEDECWICFWGRDSVDRETEQPVTSPVQHTLSVFVPCVTPIALGGVDAISIRAA